MTWANSTLRAAAEVALGRQRSPQHAEGPHMVRYLRAANVKDGVLDLGDVMSMNFTPEEQRIFSLRPGDVLVTEGSGSLASVGASAVWRGELDGMVCFQNTLLRMRPRPGTADGRFLEWWARSAFGSGLFASIATGANIYHLSAERVRSLSLKLPPLDEQRRIADFLDAETARIDTIVATKERTSMLLDERRTAFISQICLRGASTSREMRDSDIGPIGKVPGHWKIARNKHLLREVVELSVSGNEELLTVSHITGVTPRAEKNVNMFLAESTVGYKVCRPGDLVINTLWAWMGALGVSKSEGIVSPAYGVYRFFSEDVFPPYFDLLYRTPEYVCEITRYSKGVWTSRLRLYPESFLALCVPVPPKKEQERIVDLIERDLAPQQRFQDAIRRSNRLLAQRRQALITAAVTGQIDVTTARGAEV